MPSLADHGLGAVEGTGRVAYYLVFLKDPADEAAVAEEITASPLPAAPTFFLQGAMAFDELLVEVECVVVHEA